mgnify:CR=1 FL=1
MQRYSIGTYFQVYKSFKRGTLFGQMGENRKNTAISISKNRTFSILQIEIN